MPKTARKPKTAVELARSTGSDVALASFDRPGGTIGKRGRSRRRHDRHTARQALRRGDY